VTSGPEPDPGDVRGRLMGTNCCQPDEAGPSGEGDQSALGRWEASGPTLTSGQHAVPVSRITYGDSRSLTG